MYLFGFHSCLDVPLLNIFTLDVYEINHLVFLYVYFLCMLSSAVRGPLFKWRDMSNLTQFDRLHCDRLLVRVVSHLFTLVFVP